MPVIEENINQAVDQALAEAMDWLTEGEDYELTLFDRLNLIRDVINKYGEEKFYLSYSGGMDSTVLHYMLDEALPGNNIPRIHINTGIEYSEVTKFVRKMAETDDRFQLITPAVNIKNMLEENGYPFKSKEHSTKLESYRLYGMTNSIYLYLNKKDKRGYKDIHACPMGLRYQFDPESSFNLKVSAHCCTALKKKPARQYERESKRKYCIQGVRQSEGGQRANHSSCITYKGGKPRIFKPLNPVTNEFMEWYIDERNIKLCKLYYPPFNFKRTGCKGCPYAIDIQRELDIMEEFLPWEKKQCEAIWGPVYAEYRRLGYRLRREDGDSR